MATDIAAIFYDKDTGIVTGWIRPDNYWEIAKFELRDNQLKRDVPIEQFDLMDPADKQNYIYAQTGIVPPSPPESASDSPP